MPNEIKAKEGRLQVDGRSVTYLETGAGDPLIAIRSSHEEPFDPLINSLAESQRVLSLDLSDGPIDGADQLAEKLSRAIAKLGIEHYSVLGASSSAALALALAAASPQAVEKLILISPLEPPGKSIERANLAQVKADTLVLVGTRDTSGAADTGRVLRAKLRACHLSLVYGATHAMVRERFAACADAIREFLAHGEQFIIEHESQMIRP
jgi:pimeloyl-ACP methyl ester carboxylesterase